MSLEWSTHLVWVLLQGYRCCIFFKWYPALVTEGGGVFTVRQKEKWACYKSLNNTEWPQSIWPAAVNMVCVLDQFLIPAHTSLTSIYICAESWSVNDSLHSHHKKIKKFFLKSKKTHFSISRVSPGWCSGRPGRGSAGCTQTLFLEKMISPSRPERNDVPPAPGLKVRRSEALEEARRRSRPRDISSGTGTLGPSSGGEKGDFSKGGMMEMTWEC